MLENRINLKQKGKVVKQGMLNRFLCRSMDLVAAGIGLLVLIPFFIFIAIRIRQDSPGPIFYKGKRMGRNEKPFHILKFRTMYETPDSYQGSKVTAAGDSRITPFGHWMRETKINELPQLINILKGEMSLVGPRPEDFDIASNWSEQQKASLLSIRPGMTSPASIMYRNEEQMLNQDSAIHQYLSEILPDKLRMDMLYVTKKNLLFDIDVIFYTLLSLLPHWRQTPLRRWELYYGPVRRFLNRYVVWSLIDGFLAVFSLALTSIIYRLNAPLDVGWGVSVLYALIFALCYGISNYFFHLYAIEWSRAPSHLAVVLLLSSVIGMLGIEAFQWLFRSEFNPLPILLTFVATVLTWFLSVAVRYRERLITTIASRWVKLRGNANRITENALIVGAGRNAYALQWLFDQSEFHHWFNIAGFVDDEHTLQMLRIGSSKVLGTTENIPDIVRKYNIGLICYTINNITEDQRQRIIKICNQTGVRTVEMPDFFGILYEAFQPGIPITNDQRKATEVR